MVGRCQLARYSPARKSSRPQMVGAGFAGRSCTDNLIVRCCETAKKDKQIVPGKSSGVRSFFAAALETHYTIVSVYFYSTCSASKK